MRKGAKLRSKFMLRKHRDGTIRASIAAYSGTPGRSVNGRPSSPPGPMFNAGHVRLGLLRTKFEDISKCSME